MPEETGLSTEEQELFNQMQSADKGEDNGEEVQAKTEEEIRAPEPVVPKIEAKPEGKPEEKVVPLAALHESRSENKELRRELKSLQEVVAKGDQRLQTFMERLQKQVETPPPKFEDNPAEALKHENETLKRQVDEISAKIAAQDGQGKQNADLQRFRAMVEAREAHFAKENTDYFKAAEFVATKWREEFEEAGFDEEQIPQLVFQKSLGITGQAAQKGKDPAATIYALAKKFGYAVEKQKETPKDSGASKLSAIVKGQEAAKSGSAGGGEAPTEISFANLASLSEEQFNKLANDEDLWKKVIQQSPLH
jgi:hypothetical protein